VPAICGCFAIGRSSGGRGEPVRRGVVILRERSDWEPGCGFRLFASLRHNAGLALWLAASTGAAQACPRLPTDASHARPPSASRSARIRTAQPAGQRDRRRPLAAAGAGGRGSSRRFESSPAGEPARPVGHRRPPAADPGAISTWCPPPRPPGRWTLVRRGAGRSFPSGAPT
jgi:hypothetical protein